MASEVLDVLRAAADAVVDATAGLDDWGPTGDQRGQYRSDLVADAALGPVFDEAGFGWMSEESGQHHTGRPVVVVADPVDGSTNASRGIPWFATSLAAVREGEVVAALVRNLASGVTYEAVAGEGAFRDGEPIAPRESVTMKRSIVALSGYPPHYLGWKQFRALGAAALDLCAVADGTVDGYIDCSVNAHGSWDYLAGLLVCAEAGAPVVDLHDRPLVTIDHDARRTPIAASGPALLAELVAARQTFTREGWQ